MITHPCVYWVNGNLATYFLRIVYIYFFDFLKRNAQFVTGELSSLVWLCLKTVYPPNPMVLLMILPIKVAILLGIPSKYGHTHIISLLCTRFFINVFRYPNFRTRCHYEHTCALFVCQINSSLFVANLQWVDNPNMGIGQTSGPSGLGQTRSF